MRLRSALALAGLAGALLVVPSPPADAACVTTIVETPAGTRAVTECADEDGDAGEADTPPASPGESPAVHWATGLVIGPPRGGPDGFTCYDLVAVAFASESARDLHSARIGRLVEAVRANTEVYLRCDAPAPADEEAGPVGAPSPDDVAEAFLNTVSFRAPDPRIRPGHALAGLAAYLEPGGTTDVPPVAREDSPYGAFRAEAESTLRVHWGQGAVDAVTGASGWLDYGERTGGPWPDGDVSFVYRDAASVTVRVVRQWDFRWRFADGPSGVRSFTLSGTLGPIRIGEVQAIRLR